MEIVLENASCKRNGYTALYDLNVTIRGNKITAIMGKNKTPFAELISGIIPCTTGTVQVGEDIIDSDTLLKVRQEVALVRQNPQDQFFTDCVKDELEFIVDNLEYHDSNIQQRMLSSLYLVGLDDSYLDKKIVTLSSGEKKLIQVAVSLICNPRVIIFDEPLVNLDFHHKKSLIRLIKMLKAKYKKTIIIISNDSDLLYSLADDLIILAADTIVVSGRATDLFKSVELLKKYKVDVPDLVSFVTKARDKNVKLSYQKDILDLIKDVYKHV